MLLYAIPTRKDLIICIRFAHGHWISHVVSILIVRWGIGIGVGLYRLCDAFMTYPLVTACI